MQIPKNTQRRSFAPDTINLYAFLKRLLRGWWVILIAAAIAGGASFYLTKMTEVPTYKATFSAFVNNFGTTKNSEYRSQSDIVAARDLATTYKALLTSRPAIEKAIELCEIPVTYEDIKSCISISTLDDTEILNVSVVSSLPEVAVCFATALEQIAPDYMENVIEGSSMVIVEPVGDRLIVRPVDYMSKTVKGMLLGAFLVFAILLAMELLDNRVKDAADLDRYGIVMIGTIHDLTSKASDYGFSSYEKRKEKSDEAKETEL